MANYLVSVDSETKELPESVKNALPFNPQTVVDARVDGGNVWLVRDNETEIPLGDLTGPAGPNTVPTNQAVATALTTPGSPAESALSDALEPIAETMVPPLVAAAIASDATITEAASEAVASQISGIISTYTDNWGRSYLSIDAASTPPDTETDIYSDTY